jgi:hypothetical protein
MTKSALILICIFVALSGAGFGQTSPPPPKPVIETELKENGTRMRAIEMERFKRESGKPRPDEDALSREARFQETKRRFENIQKLQEKIVRTYSTGRTIDYPKIEKSALEMIKDALWLDEELFGARLERSGSPDGNDKLPPGVRELIILLDDAIAKFVKSPFFERGTVVDKEMFQDARERLGRVLLLGARLSAAAAGMK